MTTQCTIPWPEQRSYDERFEEWLETPLGQRVYSECLRRARQVLARGFHHFGMRCIWEAVRFDLMVQGRDRDGFKCNDHYHSRMARRLMADHPELAGLFELRKLKT